MNRTRSCQGMSTRNRLRLTACTVVVVISASTSSRAQALFVEGAVLHESIYSRTGFGLAGGMELPRRLVLHLEAEIPTWYSTRDVAHGSSGALELNYSARVVTYAVLVGRRVGASPRVHLEALTGFAALFDAYRAHGYFDNLARDGSVLSHDAYDNGGTEHFFGWTVGLDVPIRVGPHVSVVPRLRGHKTIANWRGPNSARAEIGMRWRF